MYTNQSSHSISDTVFNSNSTENSGGTLFIREANGQSTVNNCQLILSRTVQVKEEHCLSILAL